MTIAEQIREKASIAATLAATKATEQRERRRIGLNLQQKGCSHSEIAELIGIGVEEVEELLRPIAS